ncbi:hypothetical protein JTE90_027303 [Oedothorax gibbosus]|uniref:Transcription factor TFIIIC triple barrel domain-containing protein n=1 Tax=Oedothorax gibbosus TaxID=931172 RepID=A0AAV6W0U3_9ARAC|nr:hypothetical protein JTE90_027303 [Oedothorax gibbosus]
MEDSDSEYEIEESVVLVELNGIIDANFLLQEQNPTKVLGIDSDKPILQIGHYIFTGEYEHTTGTVVVYQPADSPKSEEPDFEYVCKTDTKLVMKRIFIKEKSNENLETGEEVNCTVPSSNGDATSSEISENMTDLEQHKPSEAQSEELSTESSVAQVISNAAESGLQDIENRQILDSPSSSGGKTEEPKKKIQPKKKASKSIVLDNTLIPEDNKNIKNKGQKRKRVVIQKSEELDTVDTNLIKDKNEDAESGPFSKKKQPKVQMDATPTQQKEVSKQEKNEVQMQTENDPNIPKESEPEMKTKSQVEVPNRQKKIESKHEIDEVKMQAESEPNVLEKNKPKFERKSQTDSQTHLKEKSKQVSDENKMQVDNEPNLVKNELEIIVPDRPKEKCQSKDKLSKKKSDRSEKNEAAVQEKLDVSECTTSTSSSGIHLAPNVQVNDKTAMKVEEDIAKNKRKFFLNMPCSSNNAMNEEISLNRAEGSSVLGESNSETVQISANFSDNTTMKATLNEEAIVSRPVNEENVLSDEISDIEHSITYSLDAERNSSSETVNQLVESSTDKSLLSNVNTNADEVRGDGNCSSSGDMVYLRNTDTSLDICQSSDSPIISEVFQEPNEQFEDNGASSSTSQQHRSSTCQQDNPGESISDTDASYSKSSQTDTIQPTNCEVSQSLDDENKTSIICLEVSDSNECETSSNPLSPECQDLSDLDIEIVEERNMNVVEGGVPFDSPLAVDRSEQSKRKLSSCEVTQSNNSERDFPVPPEDASECEVFSQNILPDIDNIFDRSPAESIDPSRLVAESSDEVGGSQLSLASESSTSEVSQSHRSVIQDPRTVVETNLLGLPFPDGVVCSQSTDQVSEHSSETGTDSKDLCVSSCDISKKHVNEEPILSDENSRNRGCEVSQSDKTAANTSSVNTEQERLTTNECDAPSHELRESHSTSNQSGLEMLNAPIEESAISSGRQMACEVTQSFNSANNASGSDSNLLSSGPSRRGLNEDSNNKCVSSDDILSLQDDDITEQKIDPACEVSQSFRAGNTILLGEPCGSSAVVGDQATNSDSKVQEHRNSCEVTQSLELESSSASDMYQDEDDSINECERSNSNLDGSNQSDSNAVNQSNDIEEICESSDDIIILNDESNSQSEESRPVNSSGCEVSQSFRSGDGNLILPAERLFNLGVESSNECEVYPSSAGSALEHNVNPSISEDKDICESSDDIEKSTSSVTYSSQISKRDSQEACQSTDFSDDPSKVEYPRNNSSDMKVGNEASDLNVSNEASDSNDNEINICESSEDILVEMSSLGSNSAASSSSDKSFKNTTASNKLCDSISSQTAGPSTISSISEREQNQISQSETQTNSYVLSSNVSQSDSIQVSSSNDVSSYFNDAIYSSSNAPNSTVSSNSEVSQSSGRRPYVWSGNLQFDASSSNSSVGVVAGPSNEQPFSASLSSEASAESAANEPVLETESSNPALLSDSSMSSSRNISMVESSISSSSASGSRIKKHILKKESNASPQNLSTSKSAGVAKVQDRESVILSGNSNISDLPDNSSLQNQPQVESMPHPFSFPLDNVSQFERGTDSDPRPSLLEVMVSSASDFRNSLLFDSTNFGMEKNISSIVESSLNDVRSSNEIPEPCISEAVGVPFNRLKEVTNPNISRSPVRNSDLSKTEVSGSTERETHSTEEYCGNQQQVSRSSDIGKTHSHTIKSPLTSEDISESVQPDLVQSSSQVNKGLHSFVKDTSTDSESKSISTLDNVKIVESPQSSSLKVSESSNSSKKSSLCENFAQPLESSSELNPSNRPRNVDDEISSMPSPIRSSNLQVISLDESGQCSFIEGSLIILQEPNTISNRPEVCAGQVEGTSTNRNFIPFPEGEQLLIQASNEADILNRNLIFSSSEIQVPLQEEVAPNVSTTPINEGVIAVPEDGDHSSEVSESVASEQNNLSQSVLTDDNVSCSVVQFSLNDETFGKKYSFNEDGFSGVSREAESKMDDGMSSYQSVCDDNILTVPNLSSSANAELSMYSHIGEFEDSIQSSSLDATHFSISEQIKAISSPPTFSNSESSEEHVPTSINPFVSFSSEPQNLPSLQYSLPSISNISSSFISEGISSRLGTEVILEDRSILMEGRMSDIESRCTVVRSPNSSFIQEHASILDDPISESGNCIVVEESSQMSGLENDENSQEEYEVLSEYEEIDNAVDDHNVADSSND